mmetsp:Transcript_73606/g.204570  ORF Transcript_73606/g.204570 Transcript_73606/m.204570 type:complete len:442 (+) Transcript_73606:439-1764(+)
MVELNLREHVSSWTPESLVVRCEGATYPPRPPLSVGQALHERLHAATVVGPQKRSGEALAISDWRREKRVELHVDGARADAPAGCRPDQSLGEVAIAEVQVDLQQVHLAADKLGADGPTRVSFCNLTARRRGEEGVEDRGGFHVAVGAEDVAATGHLLSESRKAGRIALDENSSPPEPLDQAIRRVVVPESAEVLVAPAVLGAEVDDQWIVPAEAQGCQHLRHPELPGQAARHAQRRAAAGAEKPGVRHDRRKLLTCRRELGGQRGMHEHGASAALRRRLACEMLESPDGLPSTQAVALEAVEDFVHKARNDVREPFGRSTESGPDRAQAASILKAVRRRRGDAQSSELAEHKIDVGADIRQRHRRLPTVASPKEQDAAKLEKARRRAQRGRQQPSRLWVVRGGLSARGHRRLQHPDRLPQLERRARMWLATRRVGARASW